MMRTRHLTLAIGLVACLGVPLPAAAEFGVGGRPVRLVGYFDPAADAPGVLAQITLSSGRDRRTFGVTALQAFKPEEEGAQVLRASALRPAVLLRGTPAIVDRFVHARPDTTVEAYGVYLGGSGTFTLGSVELTPREAAADR